MWTVTNPYEVNPNEPLIYFIQITSPDNEYRYVGKSSVREGCSQHINAT